jgi:hypothetical protein
MKRQIFEQPDYSKKPPKGTLWCVYCNDWMEFNENVIEGSNHDRCVGCTISTEDYYIKSANKLWDKDLQKVKPIKQMNLKASNQKKKKEEDMDSWSGDYV